MSKILPDIDHLFKNKIEDHFEEAPLSVWNKISKDLDQEKVITLPQKFPRLKKLAAAILILGFFSGACALYYHEYKENQKWADSIREEVKTKKKPAIKVDSHRGSDSDLVKRAVQLPAFDENNRPAMQIGKRARSSNSLNNHQALSHVADEGQLKDETENSLRISYSAPHRTSYQVYEHNIPTPIAEEERVKNLNYSMFLPNKNILELNSQASSKKKQKNQTKKSFSLMIYASPGLARNSIQDDHHFSGPGRNRYEFNKSEQATSTFSTGIMIRHQLNQKWGIQTGLAFRTTNTSIDSKTLYARPDDRGQMQYAFYCSSGYTLIPPRAGNLPIAGDSIRTANPKSKLQYLSAPLIADYQLSTGRFTFKSGIGIAANFLTQGKVTGTLENGSVKENVSGKISGLRSYYLDGVLSLGAAYQLNKFLSLELMPEGRLAVTPINKNTPVRSYANYFSITAGLRFHLPGSD